MPRHQLNLSREKPIMSSSASLPSMSFVVPSYNVAAYLPRTIDSILAQGEPAKEIIIVNDGSTDATGAVAWDYARRHPTVVRVHDQRNGGLSNARNVGLGLAQGDYVCFLDSDDWIHADFTRSVLQMAADSNIDLALVNARIFDEVTWGYSSFYDDGCFTAICPRGQSRVFDPLLEPFCFALEPNTSRRVIRRAFAERCRLKYPEGLIYEDFPVHYHTLLRASRVGMINRPLFYYRTGRLGSLTTKNDAARLDAIEVIRLSAQTLLDHDAPQVVGSMLIHQTMRLVRWCLDCVSSEYRGALLTGLAGVYQKMPAEWVEEYLAFAPDEPDMKRLFKGLHRGILRPWMLETPQRQLLLKAFRRALSARDKVRRLSRR